MLAQVLTEILKQAYIFNEVAAWESETKANSVIKKKKKLLDRLEKTGIVKSGKTYNISDSAFTQLSSFFKEHGIEEHSVSILVYFKSIKNVKLSQYASLVDLTLKLMEDREQACQQ